MLAIPDMDVDIDVDIKLNTLGVRREHQCAIKEAQVVLGSTISGGLRVTMLDDETQARW